MRFNTLDVVETSVIVLAIILSIIAMFIGNVYAQACLVLPIAVLLAAGWVIRMIGIYKK